MERHQSDSQLLSNSLFAFVFSHEHRVKLFLSEAIDTLYLTSELFIYSSASIGLIVVYYSVQGLSCLNSLMCLLSFHQDLFLFFSQFFCTATLLKLNYISTDDDHHVKENKQG